MDYTLRHTGIHTLLRSVLSLLGWQNQNKLFTTGKRRYVGYNMVIKMYRPIVLKCYQFIYLLFLWGAVAECVGIERGSLNPEVPSSYPTDAVSNLGQVRLPHVAVMSMNVSVCV